MFTTDDALERARRVRLVAMDVDGVLTDGSITHGESGEMKTFSVKDGLAMAVARHAGLKLAIISGRRSLAVEQRAKELKLDHLVQGCSTKASALQALCELENLPLEEAAFIGDDWNDLPALRLAGLAVTPGDAAEPVQRAAHVVTEAPGGKRAVREFLEWLLEAQGGWEAACESWLESLEAGKEPSRQ